MRMGEAGDYDVGMVIDKDSVELHLPAVSHYAAVELEV